MQRGDEGDLSNAFAAEMDRIPGVRLLVSWKCLLLLVSDLISNQMISLPQGLNIYINFISYLLNVVLPPYRYIHFDFHHVCRGGNFDNLQALYNQIEEAIHKQG